MQHIGSQVDWDGWLIGKTMAAEHVVKDAQFDGIYTTEWDSDGFGNAIWFDILEETAEFITKNFPLAKNKKNRAKQIKYMPLQMLARFICRTKDSASFSRQHL